MSKIKEEYDKICFSLKEKEKEFQNNIFTLNTNAYEIAKEIEKLREEKEKLEKQMEGKE